MGKRILISSGPMRTAVDSVRYLQNRSSGRFGLEIARAAAARGHDVHVLLGPVERAIADSYRDFAVSTYVGPTDYAEQLATLFAKCDVFFSLAAVLDFEVQTIPTKIERAALATMETLALPIRPVEDLVAKMASRRQPGQQVIAFAAETGDDAQIQTRAKQKLLKKNADAIVANPVRPGLGPEAEANELWILWPDGGNVHLGPAPKSELAGPLLDRLLPRKP